MDAVGDIAGLRAALDGQRHRKIGLVPTMGNLHAGHLELVHECRRACDVCVVSIFVNPTQFGPNEDYGSYPRTLDEDLKLLAAAGTDLVFNPPVDAMYPHGQDCHVTVSVPSLAHTLCGEARPGHFDGVATVVAKLLNIVAPDEAFFGEKDWQQLTLIRTMVRQLDMPFAVTGVPTVREASGLAMSSRNNYLSDEERQRAALLNRVLNGIKTGIERGDHDYETAEARGQQELTAAGFDVDYVAVRDAARLVPPDADTHTLRILAAARLGRARLIDNVGVAL
ncbi:MAG: pantoate--beta-alanine ligase [Gammaproteobacteria bacterium]|nr:pantoate--beta-alanine ligase [Gammaproteobacteria bacterium]MDE0440483.1 pantoate--beta-alanine ligase [Gammaproteobacteria bacterium]